MNSKKHLLFNNEFYPEETPIFGIENRGFRYGDGVFESMRMINGKVQLIDLHVERILKSLALLKIENTHQFDAYFVKSITEQLAHKNKLGANARFRLHIFRSGAGLYTPDSHKASFVLQGNSLIDSKYTLNKRGLVMHIFDQVLKPINALSSIKSQNALVYVLASIYKEEKLWDDVIVLNQDGYICESSNSNIFIRYNGEIYTPSLADGCIDGVMRRHILQIAEAENITISEAQLRPEILEVADEVFVTNAVKGVQWVMGFGDKRYFRESTHFFSDALNKRIS